MFTCEYMAADPYWSCLKDERFFSTYRIDGDTAEIDNGEDAAISPTPTGAVAISSTLGCKPGIMRPTVASA